MYKFDKGFDTTSRGTDNDNVMRRQQKLLIFSLF